MSLIFVFAARPLCSAAASAPAASPTPSLPLPLSLSLLLALSCSLISAKYHTKYCCYIAYSLYMYLAADFCPNFISVFRFSQPALVAKAPCPAPSACLLSTYANCTLLNVSTGTQSQSSPPTPCPTRSPLFFRPRFTWPVLSTENISCLFSLDVCVSVWVCVCPWQTMCSCSCVCLCVYVCSVFVSMYLVSTSKCSYNLAAAAAAILYKFY